MELFHQSIRKCLNLIKEQGPNPRFDAIERIERVLDAHIELIQKEIGKLEPGSEETNHLKQLLIEYIGKITGARSALRNRNPLSRVGEKKPGYQEDLENAEGLWPEIVKEAERITHDLNKLLRGAA